MYSIPTIDDHFKRETKKRINQITARQWQETALKQLANHNKQVFVAEVCPGGGKTMFGCLFAAKQYVTPSELDVIVVCLVPSLSIKNGWVETAKRLGFVVTGDSDNFTEDVVFRVVTYAGAKRALENIPANSKILLICDEYHHAERDKEWGNALENIAHSAYRILMLSGTPWRTDGYIALLKNNGYYQNGTVKPDYSYGYADDLKSITRGTVPLHFELVHSRAYVKNGGLKNLVSEYLPPITEEDWEESSLTIPVSNNDLGKHVGCENVYKNETAITILNRVKERLEQSRQWHCPHAIALIVARNKREADNIGRYLRERFSWTVQVIHSGTDEVDTHASKKIQKIQDELAKSPNPKVPDAIVSVGMISEGVDIPAIKVVGYLSAISTMLYIIQVIFRAARRIPVKYDASSRPLTDTKYYDEGDPTMTKAGYIIAPAEPTFVYLSANLKKQIKMVVNENESTKPEDDILVERERLIAMYETESNGHVDVVNSCLIPMDVQDGIKYLQDCPSVIAEYCGRGAFRLWVDAAFASNSEAHQKGVISRIRDLMNKYADEVSEVRRNLESPSSPSPDVDYDAQISEAKAEIQRLTNKIRWSTIQSPTGEKYCDLDNDIAYRLVSGTINRLIGIKSLSQATLATRIKWIETANNYYMEKING